MIIIEKLESKKWVISDTVDVYNIKTENIKFMEIGYISRDNDQIIYVLVKI